MLRLSPSDFAFLWEQCKRCFHLKVVHSVRQPSMPMAGIFRRIEGLQMDLYDGKRTEELIPELPPGTLRCGEKTVESEPDGDCYVYGKTDSLIEFDDGSWGILDFKTTQVKPEKAVLYGRQLHAYAHAFENPAAKPQILRGDAPSLKPISRLGLLCFEPSELTLKDGRQHYSGEAKWIEIPRDDAAFKSFVAETVKVLKGVMPAPTPSCNWCEYARTMKERDFGASAPPVDTGPTPECPKCGSPMRERSGKFGRFFGCTKYPECRGTRQING